MELRRLDNVLVWQSGWRCPCPDPRDSTNVIGLGHRSRGYIVKGSLGLPTMPMENYPETCLFCMYGLQHFHTCQHDVHALIPETSLTPLAWGTEAVDTS